MPLLVSILLVFLVTLDINAQERTASNPALSGTDSSINRNMSIDFQTIVNNYTSELNHDCTDAYTHGVTRRHGDGWVANDCPTGMTGQVRYMCVHGISALQASTCRINPTYVYEKVLHFGTWYYEGGGGAMWCNPAGALPLPTSTISGNVITVTTHERAPNTLNLYDAECGGNCRRGVAGNAYCGVGRTMYNVPTRTISHTTWGPSS